MILIRFTDNWVLYRKDYEAVRNGFVKSRLYEEAERCSSANKTEIKGSGMRKANQLLS